MAISVRANEVSQSVENSSVYQDDCEIYELAREEQVFSPNELAKIELATELRIQGLTIEAISRMLSISQEVLLAEFDS